MANLSGVTKYFPTPSEGYSSTLSSTIVSGATVVPVASASQYDDGDVVVLIVDPKTSDEAVFTGTKTSLPDRFIDCVWTEGNVGVGHASGAVIADYVTATHLAMVTEGLSKSHNQDGSLKTLWTQYVPVNSGFSSTSTNVGRYSRVGSIASVYLTVVGTSNSGYIGLELPYPPKSTAFIPARVLSGGVIPDSPGMIEIVAGSTAAVVYRSFSGGTFVASGAKALHPINFTYEIDE